MEVREANNFNLLRVKKAKFEVTPFLSPLPAANNTININIPQAIENPVKKVRSLLRLSEVNISEKSSICIGKGLYRFFIILIPHELFNYL